MKLAIFGRVTDSTDYKVLLRYFEYLWYADIPYTVYHNYWLEICERKPDLFAHLPINQFQHPDELFDTTFLLSFGGMELC